MAIYTAHLPRSGDAENAVFVRDGFSMAAYAFGPLWLFARGAWLSGSALLVGMLIGFSVMAGLGINSAYLGGLLLLLQLLIGLEGSSLLRLDLGWRGYGLAAVVAAKKPDEAEARFFSMLPVAVPVPTAHVAAQPTSAPPLRSGIIGSFPLPSGGARNHP